MFLLSSQSSKTRLLSRLVDYSRRQKSVNRVYQTFRRKTVSSLILSIFCLLSYWLYQSIWLCGQGLRCPDPWLATFNTSLYCVVRVWVASRDAVPGPVAGHVEHFTVLCGQGLKCKRACSARTLGWLRSTLHCTLLYGQGLRCPDPSLATFNTSLYWPLLVLRHAISTSDVIRTQVI